MNVYIAVYYREFKFGGYEKIHSVVVANTTSEALGLALEDEPGTLAAHWKIEKINSTEPNCTMLNREEN